MSHPLVLGLVVLLQVPAGGALEDLLRRLEEGEPPPAAVARNIGRAAVARITPSTDAAELERLARLARAGKADDRLARALLDVVAGRGEASPLAAELLDGLPAKVVPRRAPDAAVEQLTEVAAAEGPSGQASARLLGRWASPATVAALFEEWGAEHPARAYQLTARLPLNEAASGAEWLTMASELGVEPTGPAAAWVPALGEALREMALRDLATADRAVELAVGGATGPGAIVLRAVGATALDDPKRVGAARSVVLAYVQEAAEDLEAVSTDELVAAVRAAADLYLAELPALLPSLALGSRAPAVRVAAADAMALVCFRDAQTVDVLIDLLDDPDVQVVLAAHAALRAKTGESGIPAKKVLWQNWRGTAQLPDEPPEDDAAWLDAQRDLEARTRASIRDRYAPPAAR